MGVGRIISPMAALGAFTPVFPKRLDFGSPQGR